MGWKSRLDGVPKTLLPYLPNKYGDAPYTIHKQKIPFALLAPFFVRLQSACATAKLTYKYLKNLEFEYLLPFKANHCNPEMGDKTQKWVTKLPPLLLVLVRSFF
jgi:hypothetical protein